MNLTNGTLTRELSNVRSYQVRNSSSTVASCAG
jgi:hypothetical protein